MSLKKYSHKIIFACLFLLVSQGVGSQDQVISNEEIARVMLLSPLMKKITANVMKNERINFLPEEEQSSFLKWVTRGLLDSCVARGFTVFRNGDSLSGFDREIILTDGDMRFSYRSLGNKLLFFNKGYRRTATGKLHLTIQEKNGRVVFSKLISEIYQDTISSKSIKVVETENLSFTKGEKIDSSIAKKIVGPLIFTAATITVVYLFYSLRSGS